ncbi:MAG: FAD-dependent oxidoreductase [Bacteroidia bacterium]
MGVQEKKKVVVLGGGVAGMSAAQELIERGFEVEVYERNIKYAGGKARSIEVSGTNTQHPLKYLPGEHGFRFFPGFYKHVTDTMKRIPYVNEHGVANKHGCLDNLTSTSQIMIARNYKAPIFTVASFPKTLKAWRLVIHDLFGGVDTGLTKDEELFFAKKVWQLITSSTERRENDYEKLGWWQYLEADKFSITYQHLLVEGLTRTLVAAQAKSASTKTGGDIFLQLIFKMLDPTINTERVLNGPTNERWIYPWQTHLKNLGVKYYFDHPVQSLQVENGKIKSATVITTDNHAVKIEADYFVLATPVEVAAKLINDDLIAIDQTLSSVKTLAQSVSWMNGIQYYLNEDVQINPGHVIYSDSEWAITSISQVQFWKDYDLSTRYNGKVKGVLSVDISDWLNTKYKGKLAEECDPKEVMEMVWEQMESSLNVDGKVVLKKEMIEYYYLDRDIKWKPGFNEDVDKEPLLVNTINSWALRPEAFTQVPNLFLASDYVRTNTDLATMEGANEAARRAVNGILRASGSDKPLC